MTSTSQDPRSPAAGNACRPRYHIGRLDDHEELRIPAAWPGLKGFAGLIVTLPLWILAASIKFGVKTFYSGWQSLVFVFAIATCVFIGYAILQIVWWLGGAERIAMIGEDLLVRHTILGIPVVTRSYRGREIRFLGTMDVPPRGWLDEPLLPFAASGRCGRVKFYYREATVYLGHDLRVGQERGLDDGKGVVAWLAQRLPSAATTL